MNDDEQGYNGWKNYETWCMALWIDNDEGSYTYSREIVSEARIEANRVDVDYPRTARGLAADSLKTWRQDIYQTGVERLNELDGFLGDLLGAAWSEIDWYEIADNFLNEMSDV